jgi:carbamoyl-phosphate synthase small subunit
MRLRFGHRGVNQPVVELATGRVAVTSHNHGFAVDEASLPDGVRVTHRNANDGVVEGLECLDAPAFSVQYHPEAAPGPHDAHPLFQRFAALMEGAHRG